MVNKSKVVAIIQARMQSSRLPGKVLLPLAGHSVLWWMVKRASLAKLVDEIVIATTINPANDPIRFKKYFGKESLSVDWNIFSYNGIEDDVIGRVLDCADEYKADIIVDLTADCPMVSPHNIDTLIKLLLKYDFDYVSNCIIRSWPDGLDIQVYKTEALQECKDLFSPQQHCGWNIAQYPVIFKTQHYGAPNADMCWPELGLTLDTPEDYELLKIIFDIFGMNPGFHIENVIEFLIQNPHLVEINKSVRRKAPEEG